MRELGMKVGMRHFEQDADDKKPGMELEFERWSHETRLTIKVNDACPGSAASRVTVSLEDFDRIAAEVEIYRKAVIATGEQQ